MSRCRRVIVTLFFVLIVPRLAHSDVTAHNAARVNSALIRELQYESDPSDSQDCSSLGQLDITFYTDGDGPPAVGMVVTDPRGRRIGFDPLTRKSWDELPQAEGRIVCDPILGDACRGRIQVCGPVSGTFQLEIIARHCSSYSLNVSAHSKEIYDAKGLESSDSAADLSQVSIRAGTRDIVMVHYSRDREQKVAVELKQPIRARNATIPTRAETKTSRASTRD